MAALNPPVVLIVEDERRLADFYTELLADTYTVRTAYDGDRALDLIDETVDVVLLDRHLPDYSGDEVLCEIRRRGIDCHVAMVTAVVPDFDILELGFDDYVEKPVFKDELEATVERLLHRNGFDAALQEYFALTSKKSVLVDRKLGVELSTSDEYDEFETRLAELRAHLETTLDGFDRKDLSTVVRDVGAATAEETQILPERPMK